MIEGKTINLRALELEDLKQLRDWRNSLHIRQYTREYRLLNMENQIQWFKSLTNDKSNIMFGITTKKPQEALIGVCGLTHIDWKNRNAEISIYLGEKKWQRKGYASDALQALIRYGFFELGLHRLYAIIFQYNKESIKFFEKNGFEFEGLHKEARYWNGKYHDELIYGYLRREK